MKKIDGIIYDMSPALEYKHGIVNSNIYTIIKQGLKNSIGLVTMEIYYLVDGKYILEQSYMLQEDKEDKHYNAETEIRLREFPHIKMLLGEIFEGVD